MQSSQNVEVQAPVDDSEVFTCQMCGQCCRGQGGIVVSPTDLARILKALGMDEASFRERYGEMRGGKLQSFKGRIHEFHVGAFSLSG